MYVVAVNFFIKPGNIEAFLPLMMEQARNSLEKEPDCHVFDVCQNPDDPNEVFLYEVYTDRAAFDLHLASEHFKEFDAAVQQMVSDKMVTTYLKV